MSAVVAAPRTQPEVRPAGERSRAQTLSVRACAGGEIGWQPVADRPPLRLTRRGRRLVAAVSVLVFGSAVFVIGQQVVASLSGEPAFTNTMTVQVGAGQSLWEIAQETNPGVDPRIVVEEIAKLNGLRSAADLTPGETLVVPVR